MKAIPRFINNHSVGFVIVLIWILMLGWLVQKHYFKSPFAAVLTGSSVSEFSQEWMGIYFQDNKIGYSNLGYGPDGEGYRYKEQSYIEVTLQGFHMEISTRTFAVTDKDFSLKRFDFEIKSGLVDTKIRGEVAGKVLKLEMETKGTTSTQNITLKEPPKLPNSISAILRGKTITTDMEFRMPVFDPGTMSSHEMFVEVEAEDFVEIHGEKYPSFRLGMEYAGIKMRIWIDADGRILKQSTPLGWTMLRETEKQALTEGWKDGAKIDIITANSVKAVGELENLSRDTKSLRIYLNLDSYKGLDISGGRQTFNNKPFKPLDIRKEKLTGFEIVKIPVENSEFQEFLEPGIFYQIDDSRIIEQAREIVGDETNALKAAQ